MTTASKSHVEEQELLTRQQTVRIFIAALDAHAEPSTFIGFFNNTFFALRFGKRNERKKRDLFYKSLNAHSTNPLCYVVARCLRDDHIKFFTDWYAPLQAVCADLLRGALFDATPTLREEEGVRKIEAFRAKGVPAEVWAPALAVLDPELPRSLR